MIICLLKSSIVLQILAADATLLGMMAFYIAGLPMSDIPNNFIQIFNEFGIWLCCCSLVVFTDFIPSPVDRYDIGWYLLYFVGVQISINILVLILSILLSVYKAIRTYLIKRTLKKKMAEQ